MQTKPTMIVIAGSSSLIAQALIKEVMQSDESIQLVTISRQNDLQVNIKDSVIKDMTKIDMGREDSCAHVHLSVDMTDPASVDTMANLWKTLGYPDRVFHCSGVLHDQQHQPEKSISQLNSDWLHQSLSTNVMTHAHLAQSIAPGINRRHPVRWLSLSALVGSITENQLGGWYSYRMSKAALNMLMRNLDIEWRRKNPDCRIAAVHPGTTDTPLSEPFQAGIRAEKLYSPEQTAQRLNCIMESFSEQQSGQLLFWDGEIRPW